MLHLGSLALALSLTLGHQPPSGQDGSLEGLLEKARIQRAAQLARHTEAVATLVERLEAEQKPGKLFLKEIRADLDGLGSGAALALIPWIDPGDGTSEARTFRAAEISDALARQRPAGIVGDLIRVAERGTRQGQLHAIELLGVVPERARAGTFLAQLFEKSTGAHRLEAARSLAAQGGNADVLKRALTDSDPAIVRTVLTALADAANLGAASAVLNLMRSPNVAAPVTLEIVAYWNACPTAVDRLVLDAMVALALRTAVETDARIALLDAIPDYEAADDRAFEQTLQPLTESNEVLVREAALACAALLGDKSARRELLKTYDDEIKASDDWWRGYKLRGDVYQRIREYADAAKDYEDALDLLEKENRSRNNSSREIWVELARCHVLTGKLNKAHDALEDMGMTRALKEQLREDPDFAELRAHSRYGKILR